MRYIPKYNALGNALFRLTDVEGNKAMNEVDNPIKKIECNLHFEDNEELLL